MAKRTTFYVTGWGEVQEAIASFEREPEHSKRLLALVMKDPGNAINAVAQLCNHIEESIEATRRAVGVRRMMLEYLKAQGIEGAHLDRLQEQARHDAKREHAQRERERQRLQDAFLRGPEEYAWAIKAVKTDRKLRAA